MLKSHPILIQQATAALDCAIISVAFYAAYALTAGRWANLGPISQYWAMWVGFLFFYLYFAWTNSLFSVLDFSWMNGLFSRVILIFSSAGILGASLFYLVPHHLHSRRLYLVFGWLSFGFVALEKFMLRDVVMRARREGRMSTPVLLFGRGRELSRLSKELEASPEWGVRPVARLDITASPMELADSLAASDIEEVFFCVPRAVSKAGFSLDPYLRVCEEIGRTGRVFLNIGEATRFADWQYQRYLGRPSMLGHTAELDPDQLLAKRFLDIVGGLIGCVVLVVTYPLFAAAIKVTSRGPVFFRQVRVGRNGKSFTIHKYRSMVVDAEKRMAEVAALNRMKGPIFKAPDDPRVTAVGRFMRRFSLDEWPQFVNVLRGEMSLVGTRPPTPDEVRRYGSWHHRRISIKPGLTGLWQVSGRSRISDFDEIVRLDLQYIDNWSLWLDLKIMLKTVAVVFRHRDAC